MYGQLEILCVRRIYYIRTDLRREPAYTEDRKGLLALATKRLRC